jgi:hypothetical protein
MGFSGHILAVRWFQGHGQQRIVVKGQALWA